MCRAAEESKQPWEVAGVLKLTDSWGLLGEVSVAIVVKDCVRMGMDGGSKEL